MFFPGSQEEDLRPLLQGIEGSAVLGARTQSMPEGTGIPSLEGEQVDGAGEEEGGGGPQQSGILQAGDAKVLLLGESAMAKISDAVEVGAHKDEEGGQKEEIWK